MNQGSIGSYVYRTLLSRNIQLQRRVRPLAIQPRSEFRAMCTCIL